MVRKGVLVTEWQAAEYDAREELPYFGATDADYDRTRAEREARWGPNPAPRDILWELKNWRGVEMGQQQDWEGLSRLRFGMALQVYKEGGNHFNLLQEALRYDLLHYQTNFKKVVLHSGFSGNAVCANECGHCSSRERAISIAAALEEMPIPRKDCGHHTRKGTGGQPGWCLCRYSPVLD